MPSSPYPDYKFIQVAMLLWFPLWLFGHVGADSGHFVFPDQLGNTFKTCFVLWVVQFIIIKALRDPEGFKKAFEDEPKPAKVETPKPSGQTTSSQPNLVVSQPKDLVTAQVSSNTAPKQVGSGDSELTGKLLDYVRQKGQAKTSGLVVVLGSSKRTVIRNLNKLLADGKIIREGSGAGAVYRLNENPKEGKWN
jgi:hypothetical protein